MDATIEGRGEGCKGGVEAVEDGLEDDLDDPLELERAFGEDDPAPRLRRLVAAAAAAEVKATVRWVRGVQRGGVAVPA